MAALIFTCRRHSGSCLDRNQSGIAGLAKAYRSLLKASKVPEGRGPSGVAMEDWNVVITVNDAEGFRSVSQIFQRFGDVETTDYPNLLEGAGADRILLPNQGNAAFADNLFEVLDGLEIGVDQRLIYELPKVFGGLQLWAV